MKNTASKVIFIISFCMLVLSFIIRYGIGYFSHRWINTNLHDGSSLGTILDMDGKTSVYVKKYRQYKGDKTFIFKGLAWMDYVRKVLAIISGVGIISYTSALAYKYLLKED